MSAFLPPLDRRLHVPRPAWARSWMRDAALFLAALFVLAACDSNGGGPPPSDLEGTYQFTRFEFVVAGVDDFDLLADTLVATDTSPRMEFFGGNATATLVYRVEDSPGTSFLPGKFTTGSDRVTVDFSQADEKDRFQLLLPPVVRFQILDDSLALEADQRIEDVNLRRYAPDRYDGLTQNVNGTLHLRLNRQ